MDEIVYKEESYKIIGACMEVYNKLGRGFLEVSKVGNNNNFWGRFIEV